MEREHLISLKAKSKQPEKKRFGWAKKAWVTWASVFVDDRKWHKIKLVTDQK
jgi:hypothetical protein